MSSEAITKNDLMNILNEVLPLKNNSIITASGYTSTDIALTTSEKIIPITHTLYSRGSDLYVDSNGIKCGKDGYILVGGKVYFTTGCNAADLVHGLVYINDTQLINALLRIGGNYEDLILPSIIAPVSEGDIISFKAFNQTAARGYVHNSTRSFLTIVYI